MRKWKLGMMAATTGLAVVGLGVGVGTPAHASETCRTSHKNLNLPYKPDISFTIDLCIVNRPAGAHEAFASVSWGSWDSRDSRARFDKVTVQIRAEKYDVSQASATGNLTARMNADDDGGWLGSAYSTRNSPGGWSADATVTYNINDDGKGDMTWDVYGSPVVS